LLSLPEGMRVLVAISILAFLALLWASIAIFRHIRRAHRRRRRFLESAGASLNAAPPERFVIAPAPTAPFSPEITFTDPEAPLPEVAFTDPEAPILEPMPPPAYQPYLRQAPALQVDAQQVDAQQTEVRTPPLQPVQPIPYAAPASEPEIPTSTNAFLDSQPPDPALSPLPAWPHFGFTPARPIASKEPIPYAAPPPSDSSASMAAARPSIEFQPPAPAVKPLYPSSRPPVMETPPLASPFAFHRSGQQPMPRSDRNYYNEDMGDLSDPAPAGSRPKVRIANSSNSDGSN
jgi:hypothetical protein